MSLPFVSIIVPVYNAADTLALLLDSLAALDYATDRFEVIVVDNRSNDETRSILERYPKVRVESENLRQSAYAARNVGMQSARGDILAFTDADCQVDALWLRALVAEFRRAEVGAVAGRIVAREPKHPVERLSEERALLRQERFLQAQPLAVAATANLAVRRTIMEQLGGFPIVPTMGDFEICYRLQRELNWRLVFAPEAVVRHKHRSTWYGLFLQSWRDGAGYPYILGIVPDFQLPPPASQHLRDIGQSLLRCLAFPLRRQVDDLYELLFLAVHYSGFIMGYGAAKISRRDQ